jgi:hypothetical protein
VSSDYASGASGLAGSLSRPGEVSAISGLTPSSLVPPLCSPELLRQGLGSLAPDLVSVRDFSRVLYSLQQASLAVAPSQVKVPLAWKTGCGLAFPSFSSGAEDSGELLRLSLLVKLESRSHIYPSESKLVMKYSRKRKDARLNKFLLVDSLAVITASPSPLGHHPLPPLESVAVMEPPVSFCLRGFLLPRNHSSPLLEVGESSRGGVSEEVVGSPGAMFDAALCLQTVGISFEGNVKGFLDVMAQVVKGQRLEVPVSTSKVKGTRKLHNLECNINYDVRSLGFTRGKSKRVVMM